MVKTALFGGERGFFLAGTSVRQNYRVCSGLMHPDTDLGENARHGEVFDEQAKTYVSPEFKQQAACLRCDRERKDTDQIRPGDGQSQPVLTRPDHLSD
jgi:hypothetical protein